MKLLRLQSGSGKKKWLVLRASILIGLSVGVGLTIRLHWQAVATDQRVQQLIHDLKRQNSWFDHCREVVWKKMPDFAQGVFGFVSPIDASTIRKEACCSLEALGPFASNAVSPLTVAITDPSPDVRREALRALGSIGSPAKAATGKLLIRLMDQSYDLRDEAAGALGRIAPNDPKVISALFEALTDPIANYAAAQALESNAEQYDERIRGLLMDVLKNADFSIKHLLIRAMSKIRPQSETNLAALLHLLEQGDYYTKVIVVEVLGELQPPPTGAVPTLRRLFLQTRNEQMSAIHYGFSRVQLAQTSFIDGVHSNSWGLHRRVIYTLGKIGPAAEETIPLLVDEYHNETNLLRFDAAVARWRIDGDTGEMIATLKSGLLDPDVTARELGVVRLTEIATECPESVDLLESALRDSETRIRLMAIESLSKLGTKAIAAVPALRAVSRSDTKFVVREEAKKALARIHKIAPPQI